MVWPFGLRYLICGSRDPDFAGLLTPDGLFPNEGNKEEKPPAHFPTAPAFEPKKGGSEEKGIVSWKTQADFSVFTPQFLSFYHR